MTVDYFIAWWNIENLFDLKTSLNRPKYLKKRLKNELKGWNKDILNNKINQLVNVISTMKNEDKKGPDLLGVCEVENVDVMQKLVKAIKIPGRNYDVAHHDCADKRGIDVGFIYDSNVLEKDKEFWYEVLKREATREIYQVNFKTNNDNELIVIGNHWPSRSGGRFKTEPYRIIAGETLSYWNTRIEEIIG
ncbi:MAG: endonuclease/exonuclease/phosphatase family protein, partial [Candidatus Hodarchaeales archaeon]